MAEPNFQAKPITSWEEFLQLSGSGGSMLEPMQVAGPTGDFDFNKLSEVGSFSWNNPYKFTPWGQGVDPAAGFGGKLGGFLGNNAPLIGAGFNLLTGGLNAYTGLKGLSLAKDAFKQQKKEFNVNLSNQTQAYNTEVGDRIAGRQYNSEAERQAALAAAQLVDRSKYAKGG